MAPPPNKPKPTKTQAKTPVSKKVAPKSGVKASAKAPARTSLKSLQNELTAIQARLKSNEAKTQRHVKALSGDFDTLANATYSHSAEMRSTLNAQIETLTEKLQSQMVKSQRMVTQGLAKALENPTLENLARAIDTANDRLDRADGTQSEAITKINRNIADMALAVDARLTAEEKTRMAAMAAMKQAQDSSESRLSRAIMETDERMMLRLTELEAENASAIVTIGDKVVALADNMNARTEDGEQKLKEQVNEIALKTQAELDGFKANLQRRIDAIEDQINATDGHLNRSINSLTSRLEGLEYGLTSAPVSSVAENSHYPMAPSVGSHGNLVADVSATPYTATEAGEALNTVPVEDAFSPDAPAMQPTPIAPPAAVHPAPTSYNPVAYNAPDNVSAPLPLNAVAPMAEAVPYDPAAYAQEDYQNPVAVPQNAGMNYGHTPHMQPGAQTDDLSLASLAEPSHTQGGTEFTQQDLTQELYAAPNTTRGDLLPIDDTPLPYADPAYAEAQESMESARPGVFKSKKIKKVKKIKAPKLSSESSGAASLMTQRNKRIGAMVAGLGVITLVATQTILKPVNNPTLGDPFGETLPVAAIETEGSNVETAPTIGQYADNKALVVNADTPAATALERAAQSGDAAAQLQLGLSKLEMDDTEAGVALIRSSADQEQPAALYRLAKLYETGQGVGQDAKTARTLTERAAKGGNRIAMHDLALYYAEGRGGVDINMGQAAKWFQEAAQRGVVDSQFNLGVLFESGQGVSREPDLAFYWYGVAAGQGDKTAAARVAILREELPTNRVADTDKRVAAFKPRQIDPLANGIFKNMPWGTVSSVQKKPSNASVEAKTTIAKTQTLLSGLGYEVGPADGSIGPKTRSAIISFERANGLPETGRVNADLIDRLELAAGA